MPESKVEDWQVFMDMNEAKKGRNPTEEAASDSKETVWIEDENGQEDEVPFIEEEKEAEEEIEKAEAEAEKEEAKEAEAEKEEIEEAEAEAAEEKTEKSESEPVQEKTDEVGEKDEAKPEAAEEKAEEIEKDEAEEKTETEEKSASDEKAKEEPASEDTSESPEEKTEAKEEPAPVPEETPEEIAARKAEQAQKRKRVLKRCAAVIGGVLVVSAAAYGGLSMQYREKFFPNTTINGKDASGKTVEQVEQMIADDISDYVLTLHGREDLEVQINGRDISLHPEFDGSLETILAGQQPLRWGLAYIEGGSAHTIETMIAFDEAQLESVVDGLECMDSSKTVLPDNAYVSDYQMGIGYQVMPEQGGTRLSRERMLEGVSGALVNLQAEASLDEMDAYEHALVTEDDPALQAEAERKNRYTNVTVTYHFGDETQVLNGDITHDWMSEDPQGNVVIDEEKVAEYVKQLAETWDTAGQPKKLMTSYGSEVMVYGGNYGWKIDQKEETAALLEILQSGQGQDREPVYAQTAASRGESDFGDTYVEVNLAAQHLFFYKDGNLVIDSDLVSGNPSRGNGTPDGAYFLAYKERNRILRGSRRADGSYEYASPVSYWMPFNGGIGLHDATWRGAFGGKIYRTNGSHGCVNLPKSVAKTIYEVIEKGDPVLCYTMDPTAPPQILKNEDTKKTDTKKTTTITTKNTSSAAPAAAASAQPAAPAQAAVPAQDPNLAVQDPNLAAQDPNLAAQDPNLAVQDPNQAAQDPNQTAAQQPAGPGEVGPGVVNQGDSSAQTGPGVTATEAVSQQQTADPAAGAGQQAGASAGEGAGQSAGASTGEGAGQQAGASTGEGAGQPAADAGAAQPAPEQPQAPAETPAPQPAPEPAPQPQEPAAPVPGDGVTLVDGPSM